jgi:hypothetical protein
MNTKLYIAGEVYDIPKLKVLAAKKYQDKASKDWSVAKLLSSLDHMYQHTREEDRFLKKVAIHATTYHVDELLLSQLFSALCRKYGEIGFEVLKVAQRNSSPPSVNNGLSMSCTMCGMPLVETLRFRYECLHGCWT